MNTQKDEIEKWKNSMIKSAKQNWNNDKELMPVAMLYTAEDKNIIVAMPFSSQREKELCSVKLKALVREEKAIAVIFIHEGYMKQFKEKDMNAFNEYKKGNTSIKDMDGRIETIVIVFETKSGEKELTTIEINDKKLGKQNTINDGQSGGLFSNFFATPIWVN